MFPPAAVRYGPSLSSADNTDQPHKESFAMGELNLDQLHAFVQVAECGTFSGAAERLGITQPAVSLRLRLLEERVGVVLLERVGKRVRPTAAGAELLDHATRI